MTAEKMLDPSKVKAGDTVTVRVEEFDIPDPYEVKGKVYVGPIGMAVGGFLLSGDRVTVTDHQPAPEPEPVDGPADYAALVRFHTQGAGFATERDRERFERLADWLDGRASAVMIDPAEARKAIVNALGEMQGLTTWTQGGGLTTRSCRLVLDAVTTALGIEAP
jgi:hypothetical protein